jgi:hypothetical protein
LHPASNNAHVRRSDRYEYFGNSFIASPSAEIFSNGGFVLSTGASTCRS